MLTKNEIADLVIEGLAGGAAPDARKWHRNVVRKMVDTVLAEAIAKHVQKSMQNGSDGINSTWVKPFDKVTIQYDNNRNQCYITFPARIISLEDNRGLREVRPMNESIASESFPIINGLAQNVLSNLECGVLSEGVYFAAVEGDRIYFPSMSYTYAQNKVKLRVKMICGADGFSNTEILPIPDEVANTVVMRVIQSFEGQKRTPQKTQNDKNPNSV